ncbi:MAG: hypothetical protein GDA48_21280 [Hormoscilla sp. GM102CHS1]|nr:hypothetical protein [Hormoscilla sp. GM102CHS1]
MDEMIQVAREYSLEKLKDWSPFPSKLSDGNILAKEKDGCGQKQLVRGDLAGCRAKPEERISVKLCHNWSPECFAPTAYGSK